MASLPQAMKTKEEQTEKELKQEIKKQVGIANCDLLLDYHVNNVPAFASPREGLESVLKDLAQEEKKAGYRFFFQLGNDHDLQLFKKDQKLTLDRLSLALEGAATYGTALLPKINRDLEFWKKLCESGFAKYSLQEAVEHSYRLFAILHAGEDLPIDVRIEKYDSKQFIENLDGFSRGEIAEIYQKYLHEKKGKEKEYQERVVDLTETLSRRKFSQKDKINLLAKVKHGRVFGDLMEYLKAHDPRILQLDPKQEEIKKIARKFSAEEARELLDFTGIESITKKELSAYCRLAERDPTKEATEILETFRALKLQKSRLEKYVSRDPGDALNQITGKDYFPPGEFKLLDEAQSTAVFSGNELFVYYARLLAAEKDNETLWATRFVQENLPPLYVLEKTGELPLKSLVELVGKVSSGLIEDELVRGEFYYDAFRLAYIFSLGRTVEPSIFLTLNNIATPKQTEEFLSGLCTLRKQDQEYLPKLEYLCNVANEFAIPIADGNIPNVVLTLPRLLAQEEGLKCLFSELEKATLREVMKKSEEEEKKYGKKEEDNHEEPLLVKVIQFPKKPGLKLKEKEALESLIEGTSQFYELLKNSCDEETIRKEYRDWVEQAKEITKAEEWYKHWSPNGPATRQVWLKYNAPATFEEQQQVARYLIKSICGKDLHVEKKKFQNLAAEIPFGGGNAVALPAEVSLYPAKRDNAWFYNILAALYAGMHKHGGFELTSNQLAQLAKARGGNTPVGNVNEYLALFPQQELAETILINTEQIRLFSHLQEEYPGLSSRIGDYYQVRERIAGSSFTHLGEEAVFRAVVGHMLGKKSKGELTTKIQELLTAVEKKPTLYDSLESAAAIYAAVEDACAKSGKPLPKKEKRTLDARILEEVLQARLQGKKDVLVYDNFREGPYHNYPELHPEGSRTTTVFEEVIPARPNSVARTLLKKRRKEILAMQQQLELLAPRDPYLQRRQVRGHLDPVAARQYKIDLELGRVPNPRIFYKKVVEKREVATVLALNLGRTLNLPCPGAQPRMVVQEMVASFLEGSRKLGDNLGIYGFSGTGKDNVVVYVFKDLLEPVSENVYRRLGLINGMNYNRNGAAYRHLTQRLSQVDAKKKFFIELAALYAPFDVGYQGEIAVQDSAAAIRGMRLQGIEPFCIGLSEQQNSRQNLESVFGKSSYFITSPEKIFQDLTQVYSRLTKPAG